MSLGLGDVHAARGERGRGVLRVGRYADGSPIELPVLLVRGLRTGPRLWVQAAVHGDESGGTMALIRLANHLDPRLLRGDLVAVPAVNVNGFVWQRRNTPLDLENLNRVFPGDPRGTLSPRIAAVLWEAIQQSADVIVDLHSGGGFDKVPFYAIFHDVETPAGRESERLARAVGSPLIWASREPWLTRALMTVATEAGLPAVIVECGGGDVTVQDLDRYESGLLGIMRALEMIEGAVPHQPQYTYLSGCEFVYSAAGGIFVPHVQAGDICQPETVYGEVFNLYGDRVETFTATAPVALLALRGAYLPVSTGDFIAEAVRVARVVRG